MMTRVKGSNPLADLEAAIDWVVSHPEMSPWLRTTLSSARDQDPHRLMNDLEILRHLLFPWAREQTVGPSDLDLKPRTAGDVAARPAGMPLSAPPAPRGGSVEPG